MNITTLSAQLGTDINAVELFEEAFTHKSYANEDREAKDNERLEFLGDAVLELLVTEHLFEVLPNEPEGVLTKLRSALVSGFSLAIVAKKVGLGKHLRLSHGEEKSGGREKNPILANVFEATIGALYLDSGPEAVKEFLERTLLPRLPEVLEGNLHLDPKSAFQEFSQEKWDTTPEYQVLDESGPDHKKKFTVGVFVGEKQMGTGTGSSKQKAEISAAENAMKLECGK